MRFADFSGNVFREFPGAAVNGAVKGGTLTDTLALAAGPAVGTISGISTQFTGFEVVQVDAGAGWRAVGANTLATSATLLLHGLLRVMGTLVAPTNLTMAGLGTLAAATTGRIEVGTAGTAHAGQIVVDAAHTLISSGALSRASSSTRGRSRAHRTTACNSLVPARDQQRHGRADPDPYSVYAPTAWRTSSTRAGSSARRCGVYSDWANGDERRASALIFRRPMGRREHWFALRSSMSTITGASAEAYDFAGGLVANNGAGARFRRRVSLVELAHRIAAQSCIMATWTDLELLPAGGAVTNSAPAALITRTVTS